MVQALAGYERKEKEEIEDEETEEEGAARHRSIGQEEKGPGRRWADEVRYGTVPSRLAAAAPVGLLPPRSPPGLFYFTR